MTGHSGHEEVVAAIVSYLQAVHRAEPAVDLLVDQLRGADLSGLGSPTAPRHGQHLELALTELCRDQDQELARIGHAIRDAAQSLAWRVDDGQYYTSQAPVGDGYRHGNMHSVLASGEDFALGLFLLVPGVDYRDHRHAAPEFYLNLTGPSAWRFDFGEWTEFRAGSVLWNEPGRVHATTTGASPWLSVWAWLQDIDQPCEVVKHPVERPIAVGDR